MTSGYITIAMARLRVPIRVHCDGLRYWITLRGKPVEEAYTAAEARRCYLRLLRQVADMWVDQ